MKKILILLSWLLLYNFLFALTIDEQKDRENLLSEKCQFEPSAKVAILSDNGLLTLRSDFQLQMERTVRIKFYEETERNETLSNELFYFTKDFNRYEKLKATILEIDPITKEINSKDVTYKINNINANQWLIFKFKKGCILDVSYTIAFPYNYKIPYWKLNTALPIEFSEIEYHFPDLLDFSLKIPEGISPDLEKTSTIKGVFKANTDEYSLNYKNTKLQFSQIPSVKNYEYSGSLSTLFKYIQFNIVTLKRTPNQKLAEKVQSSNIDFAFEYFSKRTDLTSKLSSEFNLSREYENKLNQLSSKQAKAKGIFDLVRRHFRWNGLDSIYLNPSKSFNRIWDERKANSSEINMLLIRLYQLKGFDASPLVVKTKNTGILMNDNFEPLDFNRIICLLKLDGNLIPLDAIVRYGDFPMVSPEVNGVSGIIIGMEKEKYFEVKNENLIYKDDLTMLGHILGDSVYLINSYLNSTGFAKSLKVSAIEKDSLKGFKENYFVKPYGYRNFKHFIVANEYIDSLALAQEWDFNVAFEKNDNLYSAPLTNYLPEPKLMNLEEGVDYYDLQYKRNYSFTGKYAINEKYEVFLLPTNLSYSVCNGGLEFTREAHRAANSFTLKYELKINKVTFSGAEAHELQKMLKKIASFLKQSIILKRNY